MAARPSPQQGGMLDDIDAWMKRRKAEVGQVLNDAEAAGRRAWNDATRAGQDALGRTQSELAQLGTQQLLQSQGQAASPPLVTTSPGSWLDQSAAAKTVGGSAAQIAGDFAGLGRGVWHSVEGLGQGVNFATRLLDPDDADTNGADNSAWGQLFNAGKAAVDYAKKGMSNPAGTVSDIRNLGHQLYVDTVASATPMANTFGGEMARNFNLGANQGELGWDLGFLAFGGAASKALRGLASPAEISGPAKFLAQGFSPAQADYLAAPYEGMGSHFVPRWASKAIGLPIALSDSPLNVLKPTGISRGDFYELHYGVDPDFYGARLGAAGGGGSWSGKRLGLQKYGPWTSLWQGSPAPLNAAVGAAGVAGLADFEPGGDGPR